MTAKKNNLPSDSITLEIPFHDVDPMNITWHGHYVKYFEIARCKLLEKIGYGYPEMEVSGYAWPVIDMHLRYINSTHFQQQVVVTATLSEWENRLKIDYLITDKKTNQRLTKGHTIQVAVKLANGEMCLASPPVLAKKLGVEENPQC